MAMQGFTGTATSLLAVYTAAEYAVEGKTPKLGQRWRDENANKEYIFLRLAAGSADSVAAQEAVTQSDMSAFVVTSNTTLNAAFAGVRPVGATTLAAGEYGWFQIAGTATFRLGDTAAATVAGRGIVLDDDADDGAVGGIDTDVDLTGNDAADKADVELALDALEGMFAVAQGAISTTDADVEANIIKSVWG